MRARDFAFAIATLSSQNVRGRLLPTVDYLIKRILSDARLINEQVFAHRVNTILQISAIRLSLTISVRIRPRLEANSSSKLYTRYQRALAKQQHKVIQRHEKKQTVFDCLRTFLHVLARILSRPQNMRPQSVRKTFVMQIISVIFLSFIDNNFERLQRQTMSQREERFLGEMATKFLLPKF